MAAVFTAVAIAACSTFGVNDQPDPGPSTAGDAGSDVGTALDAADGEASSSGSDGATEPTPCGAQPDCERVVFVTSTTYAGQDLDSVLNADAQCTAVASAINAVPRVKNRTFMAWLSDTTNSAASRVVHGTRPYVRVDGKPIAADFNQLASGSLAAAFDLDEKNELLDASQLVWTGTASNGSATGTDCSKWTGGGGGTAGMPSQTGTQWTDAGGRNCAVAYHLYCLEL